MEKTKYCEARRGVMKGALHVYFRPAKDPESGAVRIPQEVAARLIEAGYILTSSGEPYGDPAIYAETMPSEFAAICELMSGSGLQIPGQRS